MFIRFKNDHDQICADCVAKRTDVGKVFSPADLNGDFFDKFSEFLESFQSIFQELCLKNGEIGKKISCEYEVSFKVCYVSNSDSNFPEGEELDPLEEKKVNRHPFLPFIKLN